MPFLQGRHIHGYMHKRRSTELILAGTRKSSCSCCMWGGGGVHEKEGPLMMGVLYQRC